MTGNSVSSIEIGAIEIVDLVEIERTIFSDKPA
jgi:hypothetical protein